MEVTVRTFPTAPAAHLPSFVVDTGNIRRTSDDAVVERRPLLGYTMVLTAATLWAVNGTVSKAILSSGLSALRLAEVRSAGAVVGLGLVLALTRPETLRVTRAELPFLAVFGIVGLALVQLFYFLAIHRLEIGIALLIQYVASVLVALYARFVRKEPVRRRIWVALVLALAGLSLVVDVWGGIALDGLGVVASLGAAVTFALYILLAEHAVGRRDPLSLLWWGFAFASLFWAVLEPWWSFPAGLVDDRVELEGSLLSTGLPVWLLMLTMVVVGTIVPFALLVGRFVTSPPPASRSPPRGSRWPGRSWPTRGSGSP
jgi:drug/metabolite transporter (DMT)-like permease